MHTDTATIRSCKLDNQPHVIVQVVRNEGSVKTGIRLSTRLGTRHFLAILWNQKPRQPHLDDDNILRLDIFHRRSSRNTRP